MAEITVILGDWNSTTPAAPAGRENIQFAVDRSGAIPKFSASIPSIENSAMRATFLIGIGGVSGTGSNVANPYSVRAAGTISEVRARAKDPITGDVHLMLRRVRNTSPTSDDNILSADLVISSGSIAWEVINSFLNDDLEADDGLELDIVSGSPENVTLEVYWN